MGRMDQQHGRPPWSTTGSRTQERWLGGQERAMEQRAWNTQIHYTNLDGTQPPPHLKLEWLRFFTELPSLSGTRTT